MPGAIGTGAPSGLWSVSPYQAGPADAEKRVNEVVAPANDNIKRAWRSAVVLAFMIGVAALAGAATAWFAGIAGGEYRGGRSAAHFLFK
jgi:hypothetical protein